MKASRLFLAASATFVLLSSPALAQFETGSEAFTKAVRNQDYNKAVELLGEHGATIVNVRNSDGETPLILAITRRDPEWTGFLLRQGASSNYSARNGDTPLIAAARVGFLDAARWLLDLGAKVNAGNRMGETALIVAVQNRQIPLVRYLLTKGADPDETDSAAGYSARDYARRDNRGTDMLRLIEAKKPPAKLVAKP